jgi:murein DD-endopeptidase MepM/ murein hydrolase activator NlpD
MLKSSQLLALLVLAALLIYQPTQASNQSQIERIRRQREKLFERARELKKQEKEVSEILRGLDDRVVKKQTEVESIQTQLSKAEQKQKKLQKEREKCEADLADYQQLMGERAKQIYMQGDLTYVDLLLQAASVSDFVDRIFFVQAILEQDNTLIETTEANQTRLEQVALAIKQQIESVSEIKSSLNKELIALEETRADKKDDYEAIQGDRELVMREARELEEQSRRIESQIRALRRSGSGYKGEWKGSFKKPCPGPITSPFGPRSHPIFRTRRMHNGVDIGAPEGTPIHAGGKGKVVIAGWMGGYGNTVVVDHGGGRSTLYGHMSRVKAEVGDEVDTSSVLGLVGSTGYSTGNHLHFEVRINGTPVDPLGSLK